MISLEDTKCCGIVELHGVQTNRLGIEDNQRNVHEIIVQTADDFFDGGGAAFIFFSTVDEHTKKRGIPLRQYIRKHKLGTVFTTKGRNNPNSGHKLTMFVWEVDIKEFKKFWHRYGNRVPDYDDDESD